MAIAVWSVVLFVFVGLVVSPLALVRTNDGYGDGAEVPELVGGAFAGLVAAALVPFAAVHLRDHVTHTQVLGWVLGVASLEIFMAIAIWVTRDRWRYGKADVIAIVGCFVGGAVMAAWGVLRVLDGIAHTLGVGLGVLVLGSIVAVALLATNGLKS